MWLRRFTNFTVTLEGGQTGKKGVPQGANFSELSRWYLLSRLWQQADWWFGEFRIHSIQHSKLIVLVLMIKNYSNNGTFSISIFINTNPLKCVSIPYYFYYKICK